MPDPNRDVEQTGPDTQHSIATREQPEPMEDEEKILAGRVDVDMPALLTKDVRGG